MVCAGENLHLHYTVMLQLQLHPMGNPLYLNIQISQYSIPTIFKYSNITIFKYHNIQISPYSNIPDPLYSNICIYKYFAIILSVTDYAVAFVEIVDSEGTSYAFDYAHALDNDSGSEGMPPRYHRCILTLTLPVFKVTGCNLRSYRLHSKKFKISVELYLII